MTWHDWQSICAWRAVEEADADGALLPAARRAEATTRTRGELKSDVVAAAQDERGMSGFLRRRARWLNAERPEGGVALGTALQRLRVPHVGWLLAGIGWALAAVTGFGMTELGQDRQLNLLSLPLVGILLWNAVVIGISLVLELWPRSSHDSADGTPPRWLARWLGADAQSGTGEAFPVATRFHQLIGAAAWHRLALRFRCWLHLAAALLALGSAAALYARGWSREYTATWESTVLADKGARVFFEVLFTPAAKVFQLDLPLDKLPSMHRHAGIEVAGEPALPWIHLYAATLVLGIVLPRLVLAVWVNARSKKIVHRDLMSLQWERYAARLLRATEGGSDWVTVWLHAPLSGAGTSDESLAMALRETLGGLARLDWRMLTAGAEEDTLDAWEPTHPLTVLVFPLATTPEMEVHRALVESLRKRLHGKFADAQLWVLLDARSLAARWTPDRLAGREKLWRDTVGGVADGIIMAGKTEIASPAILRKEAE